VRGRSIARAVPGGQLACPRRGPARPAV